MAAMLVGKRAAAQCARLTQGAFAGVQSRCAILTPRAVVSCVVGRAAPMSRRFATVGSEGSDPDFAPKKAEKAPKSERDVAAEIKEGTPDFPMCGFSNRAVQMLDQNKASFGAFNVLEDVEVREGVKKFSNWPTIPQLYINGEFIGGCDIMMELNASGELKKLLTEAGAASS